ncbi:hypothetical protein POG22_07150 [Geitlerinema sp. CS-897]|nr:hypothetical protein [Geitlerinema sp. CS-897]
MDKLTQLPKNLPVPVDDGACDRLLGKFLPSVSLLSTQDKWIDLSTSANFVVIYCYPMTGQPGVSLPDGWDEIPGARGCTPQSCTFRNRHQELGFAEKVIKSWGWKMNKKPSCSRYKSELT